MSEGGGDPRVFFAAERTLLAWIRTGLTVIGIGIALGVIQFVRFVRTLPPGVVPAEYRPGWATAFASLLAATGVVLAIYLLVQSNGA